MNATPYRCTPTYWDSEADREVGEHGFLMKRGVPERYTQRSCVSAAMLGLGHITPRPQHIKILKTDLWTEGVVRSREVLDATIARIRARRIKVSGYGIDIAPLTCEMASECMRSNVAVADIRKLPFKDSSFDMVLDISTIDHVPLDDALGVIGQYRRVLRTGGVLIAMFAHEGGIMWRATGNGYYNFPIKAIREKLNFPCGFRVKGEYGVHALNVKPMAYPMSAAIRLKMGGPFSRVWGLIEYSRLSRYMKGMVPMYCIIARRGYG